MLDNTHVLRRHARAEAESCHAADDQMLDLVAGEGLNQAQDVERRAVAGLDRAVTERGRCSAQAAPAGACCSATRAYSGSA